MEPWSRSRLFGLFSLFGLSERTAHAQVFRLKAEVLGISNPELRVAQVMFVSLVLHDFLGFYDRTPPSIFGLSTWQSQQNKPDQPNKPVLLCRA
jgi:hypothetical protein